MSELSQIINFTRKLCNDLSLFIDENDNGRFRIDTDQASGITLFLTIKGPSDFSFYFLERTVDIVYHGDRSDAHVILSLVFAGFLRAAKPGISCFLYDIPHPVVDDEIWGRYIMLEQMPSFLGATGWDQLKEIIQQLLSAIALWKFFFWEFLGCPTT